MNQKCWFIFNQDHHLGPFDADEIRSRFHRGELTMESQLWTEGMVGWTAYRDIEAFHKTGEKKAEQPPEPQWKKSLQEANRQLDQIEPERVQKKLASLPRQEEIQVEEELGPELKVVEEFLALEEEEELPPPLPPLPIEEEEAVEIHEDEVPDFLEVVPTQEEMVEDHTGEFEIQALNEEAPEETETDETAPHPVRWWSGMILMVIALVALIWFIWPKKLVAPFNDLSDAQRSVLTHFAKNAPDKNWLFKLMVDKEKGKLFVAANKSDRAKLTVHMRGTPDKLLSLENSEMMATLDLNDYFGSSSELTLNVGTSIAYGEYQVDISGRTSGWKPRLMSLLNTWPVFKDMTFVKFYNPEVIYSGKLMIFNGSQKQLEEKLTEFSKAIENKKVMPLKDQLQSLQSMYAFHQAIKELFIDYLDRITKGKSIVGFERKYNLEIGIPLSALILENNKRSVEAMNVDKEQSKQYDVLMRQGKELGSIAADIVTRIKKMGKLRSNDKVKLHDYFINRFDRLELEMKELISQKQNAIQSYKR
ncbi:MAG: hypothetical protein COW00_07970 [Bdellovibrio sp. CG12_big_fil_rev_8_21_14_0_65_39_13]|nr:MAG: hypothetical protein COW78_11875 [Bdellovibrio sp. CG22_combo_CG10-13_8_21_14_all_39_27]PIQ59980.1 MAG: hypothetical protein COW00_07970 [Bdellovibrio sp. CG12_big_fil_rev_8_21_14_0_65_39_13]PIR35238.1 MAG: hypothetical protein COV37_09080 [Bdellovibrio sp. CG11_big_fil_rev_8_21_14_0_20_39_38]